MFKARKRNPKQKLRRKADDEDGTNDNHAQDATQEEETATAATIALVKKKRKLLTDLQYKKGTDVVALLKGRDSNNMSSANPLDASLAGDSATASSSQEGVMEQKHKQALEQYVETKLVGMLGGDSAAAVAAVTSSEPSNSNNNNHLTQDELYRQLAQASDNLVGRSSSQGETSQGDGGNNNNKDGDVGAGGAMLVAGTGLAEVILPVEERLAAAYATQEASKRGPSNHHNHKKQSSYYGMPPSQVPVPAGAARFQVSAADRHRHYANSNNNNDNSNNNPTSLDAGSQPSTLEEHDQGRLGFDAARGKAAMTTSTNNKTNNIHAPATNPKQGVSQTNKNYTGNNNTNNNNNNNTKASDDKVYGNFLKHHRENQWRGR